MSLKRGLNKGAPFLAVMRLIFYSFFSMNDEKVDFKFKEMSSVVFANTLKSDFSILFDGIFTIMLYNPTSIDNPSSGTAF